MSKVQLKQIRDANPAEYYAFIDGEPVGYLRVDKDIFRVDYNGSEIFHGHIQGYGCFNCGESAKWLNLACRHILKTHAEHLQTPLEEQPIYEMVYPEVDDL